MDVFTWYLAYGRMAPTQWVTWGHPHTTGIDTVDGFLSSEHLETEQGPTHYTEQLIRMRELLTFFDRPRLASPRGADALGLPDGNRYVVPQSLFKLHPSGDPILRGILQADPDARLLFVEGRAPQWREALSERWRTSLGGHHDRVHWVPRQDGAGFYSLLHHSDVMLDPVVFGGGNTTYEGLAMGTPVLTLPGEFLRGRITHAMYRQLDVHELTASSAEDYVQRAVALGTDRGLRERVMRTVAQRVPSLYARHEAVRELEALLLERAGG
jgi:predicted O-linked N-acetylglucosamine transferase (SPINDLY family)